MEYNIIQLKGKKLQINNFSYLHSDIIVLHARCSIVR